MCLPHFWTTHEAHLVVFTGVQNLVVIYAVVLIIENFEWLACLAWKCLFTPPKLRFWGNLTPKWGDILSQPPKGTSLYGKTSYDIYIYIYHHNRSTSATCVCDKETKKRQRKKWYSGKLGICQDHPRRPIEIPFHTVCGLPALVISFKFHKHWTVMRCKGSKSGWFWLIPLLRPMAYTTPVLLW